MTDTRFGTYPDIIIPLDRLSLAYVEELGLARFDFESAWGDAGDVLLNSESVDDLISELIDIRALMAEREEDYDGD